MRFQMFADKSLRALLPRKTTCRVVEKSVDKGFCVQLTPAGGIYFYMQFQSPVTDRRRFLPLGRYPAWAERFVLVPEVWRSGDTRTHEPPCAQPECSEIEHSINQFIRSLLRLSVQFQCGLNYTECINILRIINGWQTDVQAPCSISSSILGRPG